MSGARLIIALGLSLLGCEGKIGTGDPTPAPAPKSTKSSAPESEPSLGRACVRDADCDAQAPRCLPFGEDNYVARPESAAVMHCSRSCEQVECPASYECKKDLVVTGATSKGIKGSVSLWCGKTVRTEPTPLQEIPLITIARYFAAGLAVPAIVSLHREGAELVVISPHGIKRLSKEQDARATFAAEVEAVLAWREIWPATVPLGPSAPGAIAPGARKTLFTVSELSAQKTAFTPERLAKEGAVLTWTRGDRGFTVFTEPRPFVLDVKQALDAFFRVPPPKR